MTDEDGKPNGPVQFDIVWKCKGKVNNGHKSPSQVAWGVAQLKKERGYMICNPLNLFGWETRI